MTGSLRVEVDPPGLDLGLIHRWLSTDAYWALGRTHDEVTRAAAGSVNLAAYSGGDLVGYARLVTDRVLFAWLCDVYVGPAARGGGAGGALLARTVELLEEWDVRRSVLRTADAHGLYTRFGFTHDDKPELWMIRRRR